jgi:hypothetical protein
VERETNTSEPRREKKYSCRKKLGIELREPWTEKSRWLPRLHQCHGSIKVNISSFMGSHQNIGLFYLHPCCYSCNKNSQILLAFRSFLGTHAMFFLFSFSALSRFSFPSCKMASWMGT